MFPKAEYPEKSFCGEILDKLYESLSEPRKYCFLDFSIFRICSLCAWIASRICLASSSWRSLLETWLCHTAMDHMKNRGLLIWNVIAKVIGISG